MTSGSVRNSKQRAVKAPAKNETHTCQECGQAFEQHPLGRSAHDRLASHAAVTHARYGLRVCQGSACVTIPFEWKSRRKPVAV
jgi:hypothetical protein